MQRTGAVHSKAPIPVTVSQSRRARNISFISHTLTTTIEFHNDTIMDDSEPAAVANAAQEQMPGDIDENELISPAVRITRGALSTLALNDGADLSSQARTSGWTIHSRSAREQVSVWRL